MSLCTSVLNENNLGENQVIIKNKDLQFGDIVWEKHILKHISHGALNF